MVILARRLLRSGRGRGLLAALAATTMTACLLPQPDFPLPDVPPQRNRPPRILESTVTPGRAVTIGNGANCAQTFSLQVEDPDVDDTITVRFYVDYSAPTPTPPVAEQVLENGGRPTRNTAAEYTSTPGNPTDPLHALGSHLVEAVVADGPLVGHDQVLDHPIEVDGGTNPSYIVTWGWVVNIVPESCPAP